MASLSIGGEVSTKSGKVTNTSEVSYHGQNGNVKETSGGGAEFYVGANREKETTINGGRETNVKTTTDVSAALPVVGAIQTSLVNDNSSNSVKSGYVNGGSVGLFLNFSVSFELGIQIKQKTE